MYAVSMYSNLRRVLLVFFSSTFATFFSWYLWMGSGAGLYAEKIAREENLEYQTVELANKAALPYFILVWVCFSVIIFGGTVVLERKKNH